MKTYLTYMLLVAFFLEAKSQEISRSIFEYSPNQSLAGQIAWQHDIVLLNNGTVLSCQLTSLPCLNYSFGKVFLNPEDIILFSAKPMNKKCEVLAKNGMHFVSSLGKGEISFLTYVSKKALILYKQFRTIPYEEISLIIPRPNRFQPEKFNQWFSLTLSNGDAIPIQILDFEILIKNEKEKRTIRTKDILHLNFNGALQGKLKKGTQLGLSFVASPNLPVAVLPSHETIKIPWHNISTISAETHLDQSSVLSISVENEEREMIQDSDFLPEPTPFFPNNQTVVIPDIFFVEEKAKVSEIPFVNASNLFLIAKDDQQAKVASNIDRKASRLVAKKPQQILVRQAKKSPLKKIEYTTLQSSQKMPSNNTILAEEYEKHNKKMHYIETTEYYRGFYISPKKVTNQEYRQFLNDVKYKPPTHWLNACCPEGEEHQPVVNVSYKDCLLYAVWAKKRLPTEEELMIAKNHSVIKDLDDSLNEWTATPYIFSKGLYPQKVNNSKKIGRDCAQGHVIFGKKSPKPLNNYEFNPQTGFRLAHD